MFRLILIFSISIFLYSCSNAQLDKDIIVIKSSSGKTYTITDGNCSCPGYTFRGNCKHVKENVQKYFCLSYIYGKLPHPPGTSYILLCCMLYITQHARAGAAQNVLPETTYGSARKNLITEIKSTITNPNRARYKKIFFTVKIIIISFQEARLATDLSDNLSKAYSCVWRG